MSDLPACVPGPGGMPIFRYFLFVGGTLLGLLVLADWYFPNAPIAASAGDVDRSIIRIQSRQQWPAAVRIDTGIAMPQAASLAPREQSVQVIAASKPAGDAYAYLPPPESKQLEKPQRHPSRLARLSKRKARQRIVAWQPLWQPNWQ